MFFSVTPVFNPKGSLQFLQRRTQFTGSGVNFGFSDNPFSLGVPRSDRRIFAGVVWRNPDGTGARTLSGITINPSGVVSDTALTIHGQVGYYETGVADGGYGVALASAIIETGATGTINVEMSGAGVAECTVMIFRKVGLIDSTPFDVATAEVESTQGDLITTIDTAEGGILLGVYAQASDGGTPEWTAGLTQVELFTTALNRLEVLTGVDQRTAAETGKTISLSAFDDANKAGSGMVIVSWR